jgi:hypothetical protein
MVIPEELLKMSEKELKQALPDNIFKTKYLKSKEGDIYRVVSKSNKWIVLHDVTRNYPTQITNILYKTDNLFPLSFQDIKQARSIDIQKYINNMSMLSFKTWIEKIVKGYFSEENYEIDIEDDHIIYLTVYYPELEITNSAEFKHTLKDVYIKYVFSRDNNKYRLLSLKMSRTTYTEKEYLDGYMFSHISTSTSILHYWSNSFCTGSGTVLEKEWKLLSSYNLSNFRRFILLFEDYLKWESLEGRPYQYIESILKPISDRFEKVYMSELYNKQIECTNWLLSNLSDFTFDYIPIYYGQYEVKLSTETRDKITELLTVNFPSYSYPFLNEVNESVKILPKKDVVSKDITSEVVFKGEKKKLYIIPAEVEDIVLPIQIHVDILEYLLSYLEKNLNEFITNKILE